MTTRDMHQTKKAPRTNGRLSNRRRDTASLPHQPLHSYLDALDRAYAAMARPVETLHYLIERAGKWTVLRVTGRRRTWIPVSCRAVGVALITGGAA